MDNQESKPNNRLSFLYDEQDLALDMEIAEEYVNNEMNFSVVLLRIDHQKSDTDDLYGESSPNDINYFEPIELSVARLKIEESQNKSYNPNSTIRYQQYGNLGFDILLTELKRKQVDVSYGDIVGYSDKENNFKFWVVQNDGKITADNKHTRFGMKGYYRTIGCVTLDPNLFGDFSKRIRKVN